MSITIKKRAMYGGGIIFTSETATTIKEAIAEMRSALKVSERLNLTGADLRDAYLRGAYLTGAYLTRADLRGADLTGAYLRGADLTGAYLTGAYLRGADLTGAYLTDANLTDAYLTGADLSEIKADIYRVLSAAPAEVEGLLLALREGRIDGSQYEGECACLVGTIANLKHCDYNKLPGLEPNASSPSERWFLAIRKGDTPANSQIATIIEGWIVEWLEANVVQGQEVTR